MAKVLRVKADEDGAHNTLIDQAIATGTPCFAYFYALWCPDCSRSTPLVESAFESKPGVTLIMVDIGDKQNWRDPESDLRAAMERYDVKCLPTVLQLGGRLDTALEKCKDPTEGQALVDAFLATHLSSSSMSAPSLTTALIVNAAVISLVFVVAAKMAQPS